MAINIARRKFIAALGGTAFVWPLAARAQQPKRRIGLLMSQFESDPEGQARVRAFLDGLQELGWADGRNVRIDIRWTAGNPADPAKYAAELVALTPDVIFASASVNVAALQRITRSVPIVFANVIDPVGAGFVASLARPGGNTTGFSAFEYSLALQLRFLRTSESMGHHDSEDHGWREHRSRRRLSFGHRRYGM